MTNITIFRSQIEKRIYETLNASLNELGYDIIRVRCSGARDKIAMQIMIDKLDNSKISTSDCTKAMKHCMVLLNVADFLLRNRYNLEISSPGVNKPLTRTEDFTKYINSKICVETLMSISGSRKFTGYLQDVKIDSIVLKLDKADDIEIPNQNIFEARLMIL